MTRRIPALLVLLAAIVAIIVGTRPELAASTPTFSVSANGWMPSAPPVGGLTETWFCPGVPATGLDGVEGEVVISNRTATRMIGSVLLVSVDRDPVRLALDVDGWASATVDLDDLLPGSITGAVVEIDGGGGLVEQRSIHPSGDSAVAPARTRPPTPGTWPTGSPSTAVSTRSSSPTRSSRRWLPTWSSPRGKGSRDLGPTAV